MPNGTVVAQQWTTVYAGTAASTWLSRSAAVSSSTAASRDSPLWVGTWPARTDGSAGSSSWTTSRAPGSRLATSAARAAAPSASEAVRSATAPGSASATFIVRDSSSVAASVQGPQSWILTGPVKPCSASSNTSRSEESMDLARARSRPGRSASRQPRVVTSAGMSTSRAAVRPVRSAPGPRSGSSARCGKPASSPAMTRMASAGSVPGIDPIPVALPGDHGKGWLSTVSSLEPAGPGAELRPLRRWQDGRRRARGGTGRQHHVLIMVRTMTKAMTAMTISTGSTSCPKS